MSVTPLPVTPPQRADPANFSARADAVLGALPQLINEINSTASGMTGMEASAGAYADAAQAAASSASSAAASANAAAVAAAQSSAMTGTSTTSLAVGTGSKSLTTQAGKAFLVGQFVIVASSASPANYMHGQVTAYNSGTGAMTVSVVAIGGSGTLAAWSITPSNAPSKSFAIVNTSSSTYTASTGEWVMCQGALQQTVTLPAGATDRKVRVSVNNGRYDVAVAPATGGRIAGLAVNETVTLDSPQACVTLEYANATKGWEIV